MSKTTRVNGKVKAQEDIRQNLEGVEDTDIILHRLSILKRQAEIDLKKSKWYPEQENDFGGDGMDTDWHEGYIEAVEEAIEEHTNGGS